jgi:hypothetical protein
MERESGDLVGESKGADGTLPAMSTKRFGKVVTASLSQMACKAAQKLGLGGRLGASSRVTEACGRQRRLGRCP